MNTKEKRELNSRELKKKITKWIERFEEKNNGLDMENLSYASASKVLIDEKDDDEQGVFFVAIADVSLHRHSIDEVTHFYKCRYIIYEKGLK